MYNMRAILLVLFVLGCGVADPGGPEPACVDGVLTVDGPLSRVLARYPDATPPERLLEHRMTPGMVVTPEGDGWISFVPFDAVPAGSRVSIETHDYASGDALCPLETVVEP